MTDMPTLETLLEQEARLALPALTTEDAVAIGKLMLARAEERSLPVTIEVQRLGRVVFRAALSGTNAHNDMYVAGKAAIVNRFGHSSLYERLSAEAAGSTFGEISTLPFPQYAPYGGGFPLIVSGTGPIGVAIVSGLEQQDDHALIIEALEAFLAGDRG